MSSKTPPPRPTTPLRPPSRSSLRSSTTTPTRSSKQSHAHPLDALEPLFAELSDASADLEANFVHLQLLHESLARFAECFAAFMYGLDVNAFCVDFPEAPLPESFKRALATAPVQYQGVQQMDGGADMDQTFLTTDSFVENPPSTVVSNRSGAPSTPRGSRARGTSTASRGRGATTTPGRGRGHASAGSTSRGRGGIPVGSRGRARGSGIARARGSRG